jgi:hypothetical protein
MNPGNQPATEDVVVVPATGGAPQGEPHRATNAYRIRDARANNTGEDDMSTPDEAESRISRAYKTAHERWGLAVVEPEDDEHIAQVLERINPRLVDGFLHLHPTRYQPPSGAAVLADYIDGYHKMRQHHSALICVPLYHGFGIPGLALGLGLGPLKECCHRPGRFAGLVIWIVLIIVGLTVAQVI